MPDHKPPPRYPLPPQAAWDRFCDEVDVTSQMLERCVPAQPPLDQLSSAQYACGKYFAAMDELLRALGAPRHVRELTALPARAWHNAAWGIPDPLFAAASIGGRKAAAVPMTVRQIVEMFDGCSGAKAGKLAAPFDKNRLARSMSDDEAAALLTAMQASARVVKPDAFGLIGPEAFDPDDYSYASARGAFTYGAHDPNAEIAHVVEAWVCATSRKGKSIAVEYVFANRTPIVSEELTAERETYDPKHIEFYGCGLDGIDDFPLGDFRVSLHIISPYIPLLSIGKRPNLEPFMPAIADALRRAFKRSRDQLPLDMLEPKEKPPPKPPRPPKIERPPKPPREIYQPQGVLGRRIAAQAEASGLTINDLRVMSAKRDPYTLDTENNHRIGQWFAEQLDRFVAADSTVHLRGLHYLLCSTAIRRPDGQPYQNDHKSWNWLQDDASKAARWLGYVPFDRIHDARNEELIWCGHTIGIAPPSSGERRITVDGGALDAEVPGLNDLLPSLSFTGSNRPQQAYRRGMSLQHCI